MTPIYFSMKPICTSANMIHNYSNCKNLTDEKAANSHLAGLPAAARCEIAPVGVKVGLGRSNAGKPCITS